MKIKTLLSGVLCLGLAALLVATPIGIPGVLATKSENDAIAVRKEAAEQRRQQVENSLLNVVSEVNNTRKFDIYYGDLENLTAAFLSMGIKIEDTIVVYPMDDFREGAGHVSGEETAAIKYKLSGESIMSMLGVLEQMELPIYAIDINGDTELSVTFMTGGTL